jgi:glucokinase
VSTFGGTNTVFGLVDATGNIIDEGHFATREVSANPLTYFERLNLDLTRLRQRNPDHPPVAVGVGAPNGNYYRSSIENPPNLGWGIVDVNEQLGRHQQVPVVTTNDANAAALGELLYGAVGEMKNFILITLGTGLGSGIVVNGEVVYGAYGFAGEIGHLTLVEGGRICGCGRRGCLETYVSATGIVRTVYELLASERSASELREVAPSALTARAIFDAANAGDAIARLAFSRTGTWLGQKLADAVAILEPEAIILFGGLANAGDMLLNPAQKALDEHVMGTFRNKTKIQLSSLQGKNIAVLGAAALAARAIT